MSPANEAPLSEPQACTFRSDFDGSPQTYLLALPPGEPAGLLMYLHGATNQQEQGMTPRIYGDSFGFVRRWVAQRGWAYACPEYRGDSWMNAAAESDVAQLLDALADQTGVRKSMLMGGSMGGTAALILASRRRGNLLGVLALCPATDMTLMHQVDFLRPGIELAYGGTPAQQPAVYHERSSINHAAQLARLPLCLAHGSADPLIDVGHSRRLAKAVTALGAKVHLAEVPGGDHDSPIGPRIIGDGLEWLAGAAS